MMKKNQILKILSNLKGKIYRKLDKSLSNFESNVDKIHLSNVTYT